VERILRKVKQERKPPEIINRTISLLCSRRIC